MSDRLTKAAVQSQFDKESAQIPLLTGRISELCKFAWVGSLAIFFALITAKADDGASRLLKDQFGVMFLAAAAGAVAYLLDYFQAICGYIHSLGIVYWMRDTKNITRAALKKRVTSGFLYANFAFFVLKNIAGVFAAGLIVWAILGALAGLPSGVPSR